jgi:prepilin-type N-terminal cleavage/methylation domain-containing protein
MGRIWRLGAGKLNRPDSKTDHARGLTLLEVLVTMLLLAMAFAMTATLVRNFSQVSAQLDGKEGTQQGSLVLLGVTAELEEAFEITTPAVGTTTPVTEVSLKKYATTPKRLELATTSDTWGPTYVVGVKYRQDGEDLIREASYSDGSSDTTTLARRLAGFSAQRLDDRTIEVRVTFREAKKLETTAAFAHRWGE